MKIGLISERFVIEMYSESTIFANETETKCKIYFKDKNGKITLKRVRKQQTVRVPEKVDLSKLSVVFG